jgi:hypothetical protein
MLDSTQRFHHQKLVVFYRFHQLYEKLTLSLESTVDDRSAD